MGIVGRAVLAVMISAMAAGGAMPAAAGAAPEVSLTPSSIRAGEAITAAVSDCDPPEGGGAAIDSPVLPAERGILDAVDGEPGTWRGSFATNPDATPGTYRVFFYCGEEQLRPPLTVTVVGPAPRFTAVFTPRTFRPGDRLTLTTSGCRTVPQVADLDHMFATHLELHQIGATRHRGSALTKAHLSPAQRYIVVVRCRPLGRVTFVLQPGQRPTTHPGGGPGGQTSVVPVGGVDTGDGSSLDNGRHPAVAPIAPIAVALALAAGLAGLGLARRRRRS
jgi:hypothetical protein